MASTFTTVDLSQLPPPNVVDLIDFETILSSMQADLVARCPAFSALLESEPAFKILEVAAFRETLLRQRVNEAAKAIMLAYAFSADLDQLGGNFNVARLLLSAGNPTAIPPVPPIYEDDESFRRRIQLSFEGYTTAGSVGSYAYHSLSADADVLDVGIASPPITPGTVNVAVLSRTGNGAAPAGTIANVLAALNADEVRPLCDNVVVDSAQIINYSITASLDMYPGAGQAQVLLSATAAVQSLVADSRRLGRDITRSALTAALHQFGVYRVNLTSPAADVVILWNQAAYCTSINVTQGATNE